MAGILTTFRPFPRALFLRLGDLRRLAIVLSASALVAAHSGSVEAAAELQAPDGTVLLRIEGTIERTNDGSSAVFDRNMLESLPQVSFSTSTIWTEGELVFSGPTLRSVLDAVGADGSSIAAVAVNDYKIDFPMDELAEDAPIIATRINGKEFGVREKGPLWVVYPYDSALEYQSELVYSRSIWQLVRIVVSD